MEHEELSAGVIKKLRKAAEKALFNAMNGYEKDIAQNVRAYFTENF